MNRYKWLWLTAAELSIIRKTSMTIWSYQDLYANCTWYNHYILKVFSNMSQCTCNNYDVIIILLRCKWCYHFCVPSRFTWLWTGNVGSTTCSSTRANTSSPPSLRACMDGPQQHGGYYTCSAFVYIKMEEFSLTICP